MAENFHIAAFYKFVSLPDYRAWQVPLRQRCRELDLRGTILLASEGINAMLAGDQAALFVLLAGLQREPRFADLDVKWSSHDAMPFRRLKVRLKREIVALKAPGVDPIQRAGAYIEPNDWNRLIQRDDVTLIDARNNYEVALGTFPGALNPGTAAFHELPQFLSQLSTAQHKKIAMFCTGGIRCEKAAAYLRGLGFEEVYQLSGGILRYLERVGRADSLWQGECFVFDERVSLDHDLRKGGARICDDCKIIVKSDAEQCPQCSSLNLL